MTAEAVNPGQFDDLSNRIDEMLQKGFPERAAELQRTNAQLSHEIAERKQGEDKIRRNHEFLKNVMESLALPFIVINVGDYTIAMANSAALSGGMEKPVTCFALFHKRDKPCEGTAHACPLEQVKRTKKPVTLEHLHYDQEGNPRNVEITGSPIFDDQGDIVQMIEYTVDITDRKRTEEALKKNEEKYRTLFESSRDAIMTLAPPSWRFTTGNPAAIALFEADNEAAFTALGPWEIAPEFQPDGRPSSEKAAEMIQTAMEKGSHFFEWTHRRLRGESFPTTVLLTRMEIGGQALLQATVRDITEQKAMEEGLRKASKELKETQSQMVHTEKMASIGQLAAGVAHEINNPVGFVSSNLKSLTDYQQNMHQIISAYGQLMIRLSSMKDSGLDLPAIEALATQLREKALDLDIDFILEDIPSLIEESRDGLDRIKKIVLDLKNFSHPGEDILKISDLNQNLESTLNIVRNELKYKATIFKEYAADIPQVKCYPQQLNQVFMNILVNAAQAIEKQGEIRIVTRETNGFVEIVISDTGQGIPKENMSRIFDPFFTSKEVGKGTGLGLNVAYNIIKKHQGNIDVQSEVGKGATFTVRVPIDGPGTCS